MLLQKWVEVSDQSIHLKVALRMLAVLRFYCT